MFSEIYIKNKKDQNAEHEQAMSTDETKQEDTSILSAIMGKKRTKTQKNEESTVSQQKIDKPKKEKMSNLKIAIITGASIAFVILVLKGYKSLSETMEKDVTEEDRMKMMLTVSQPQSTQESATQNQTQQTKESDIEVARKKFNTYYVNKTSSILFEDTGIKLVIDGSKLEVGGKLFEDFTIGEARIKKSGGKIEEASIIYDVLNEKGGKIREIEVRVGESYSIFYYYEGIRIEPIGNSALSTEIIFPENQIKKGFVFDSFIDNTNTATFKVSILGENFETIVPMSELN